jgi:anthranilate synthase component 2
MTAGQRILIIDNYDSFVYNIVHYLNLLGCETTVVRNDQFELDLITSFDRVVLSPGPGIPEEAGKLLEAIAFIKRLNNPIPTLGVCLGHQAIAESFGAQLTNLDRVYHGLSSAITIDTDSLLYRGLETPLVVGRYHSWVVSDLENLPLEVTARDENGTIMSFQHNNLPFTGVQYHPESVLTPKGLELIKNWLRS